MENETYAHPNTTFNQSVAHPVVPPPPRSGSQKQKKTPYLSRNMLDVTPEI